MRRNRLTLEAQAIVAERLRRHRLARPLPTRRGYAELLRLLQPVATISDARPGDPPRLVCRTAFDDAREADRLRARRALVKGRFLRGGIGYVLAEDLPLYANAFCKPLPRPSATQRAVLEAVRSAGPLSARQLRQETGLLAKQVMPALQRLQQAFLVYEDQVDREWDRAWFELETEWPTLKLDPLTRDAARSEILLRFLGAHVFATDEQLHDWSGFSSATLRPLLEAMQAAGKLVAREVPELGTGWIRSGESIPDSGCLPRGVLVLHRADPLVRAHASELRRRFGDREVLRTLLIDGSFRGVVIGHWGFGDYDIDDVAVELPARERARRRSEVLAAVRGVYDPERHAIVRYAGRPLR
jgi:hypothetical protein